MLFQPAALGCCPQNFGIATILVPAVRGRGFATELLLFVALGGFVTRQTLGLIARVEWHILVASMGGIVDLGDGLNCGGTWGSVT